MTGSNVGLLVNGLEVQNQSGKRVTGWKVCNSFD
jgi:hypothetical protein